MCTIEHDFDATVITLVDEGSVHLQEDITIEAFEDCVVIQQVEPITDTPLRITLSMVQVKDLAAALNLKLFSAVVLSTCAAKLAKWLSNTSSLSVLASSLAVISTSSTSVAANLLASFLATGKLSKDIMRYVSNSSSLCAIRPARFSEVPGAAMTKIRSNPSSPIRKLVMMCRTRTLSGVACNVSRR